MTNRSEKAAPVSRTGNGLEQQHQPANYIPSRTEAARNILRDAVIAAGVDSYAGMVILAAADSFAKARIRDEFAAFMRELDGVTPAVTT